MWSGLVSLPEWLGLRLLRLYWVRRTSWSKVTLDLGPHWLAPPGQPGQAQSPNSSELLAALGLFGRTPRFWISVRIERSVS